MRIGLEKERSERVSHSASQVHPCGANVKRNEVHGNILRMFNFRFLQAEACERTEPRKCHDVLS